MTDCPHGDDPASCPPCQGAGEPRRLATWRRVATFPAIHDGNCADCSDRIVAPEQIGLERSDRDEKRYVHADCGTDAM